MAARRTEPAVLIYERVDQKEHVMRARKMKTNIRRVIKTLEMDIEARSDCIVFEACLCTASLKSALSALRVARKYKDCCCRHEEDTVIARQG
jgi:hypothetical protein